MSRTTRTIPPQRLGGEGRCYTYMTDKWLDRVARGLEPIQAKGTHNDGAVIAAAWTAREKRILKRRRVRTARRADNAASRAMLRSLCTEAM